VIDDESIKLEFSVEFCSNDLLSDLFLIRGSNRNQFDFQCLLILICFVFTWLFIYLTTNGKKNVFEKNQTFVFIR
jgi:hypothetical protein